ncbi:tetratricopeptide repeat protein [Calditerrivibrio nitroreducens]|uniref:Tetratricopeptide repeat protein n=1 Tax=Calditerrivibrio nitroreducens (strain DSM 19672 / NBRC 101217 / Yu37-1) TaxID=768670 RepID=E4TFD5_CALNY|nr:tetratricopeptide repeat protein [Calditerrivibrio nitroreducens]ADR19508.1 hypothetical protein Calni_1600 [Calditerrivibrio nitroreducens DSM 19672]
MEDSDKKRKEAMLLRQQHRYEEALPIYRQLWENDQRNPWDGWGLALCLQQLKQYKESIDICEEIIKKHGNYDYIKNLYIWSLFYYIKNETLSNDEFEYIAKKILENTTNEDKIFSAVILKWIHRLKGEPNYPALKILKLLDMLDINRLNKEALEITQDGKKIEIASEYEQYFMHKSKALYELSEYEKCIEISNAAITSLKRFHYNNDIWFKWRIALSFKNMQRYDESLEKLIEIVRIKKDWFIQKEIAEIYFIQNKYDDALSFAIDSILNAGEIDKKIYVIILLCEIFEKKQMHYEAGLHYLLAKNIIDKNGWKIQVPIQLKDKFNDFGAQANDIHRELKKIWNQINDAKMDRYDGIIINYLSNNQAGFIKCHNQTYYFKVADLYGKKEDYSIGTKVTFSLVDSYDKKKNKPVKNAVKIKKIS